MIYLLLLLSLYVSTLQTGVDEVPAEHVMNHLRLVTDDPLNWSAYHTLSRLFRKKEEFTTALGYMHRAQDLCPGNKRFGLLFEQALILTELGNITAALDCYSTLEKVMPDNASVQHNIGYLLKMRGDIDEAIKRYERVIAVDNTYEAAHFALGFAHLEKGDFAKGWKQHERHLKLEKKNGDELRALLADNALPGKRVLLIPEGGFGDSIQFIRYAQLLKDRGATVIVAVQKSLVKLFSLLPYIDEVIPVKSPKPPSDAVCSLMSLPAVFYDTIQSIPNSVPYLSADSDRFLHWQSVLQKDTNFKIGICWQASIANDVSRLLIARRGIPLQQLCQLGSIKNVSFYSLQCNEGLDQIRLIPTDFPLHIFDETFDRDAGPFMDTAAVIEQMDLVISVDTAVAHLAGALAKPIWLLLPYATDWRWIKGRTDSPWYPTMRIFKQPEPFDWDTVMKEVHQALESVVDKK